MKLVSWNVNGLRAVLKKGFLEFLEKTHPDLLCLQEIRANPDQLEGVPWPEPYEIHWNPAEKRGYSGTMLLSRQPPLRVTQGIGRAEHDGEGRVLNAEYEDFHLVNVYTPNSQRGLTRLDYRIHQWERVFRRHLQRLERSKPVIVCGDFNVAHREIDLARPNENRRNAGFTDEERAAFGRLLDGGMIDTFREFETGPGHYTWWSARGNARQNNVGWRIDYVCISKSLRPRLQQAFIWPHVMGSDHCPVGIVLD